MEYYGPSADFSEALPVMGGTTAGFTCGICGAAFVTAEQRNEHLAGHPVPIRTPPCKHEWRQYMGVRMMKVLDGYGDDAVESYERVDESQPYPDGFFCIHCTERSDG